MQWGMVGHGHGGPTGGKVPLRCSDPSVDRQQAGVQAGRIGGAHGGWACSDEQSTGRPHAAEIRVTAGNSPLSCSLPFLAAAALPIAAASRPGPVPELRRGGC